MQMTNEEAIRELKAMYEHILPHMSIMGTEAYDMAIKTLDQEPCEDTISREAVINTIFYKADNNSDVVLSTDLMDRIKHLPSVTPQPKLGRWRHYESMLICSECGAEFYDDIMEYCGDDVPKYCPDCGAKMEVEE